MGSNLSGFCRSKDKNRNLGFVMTWLVISFNCVKKFILFGQTVFLIAKRVPLRNEKNFLWVLAPLVFISCLGFFLGLNFYGSISIFGVVAAETAPPHLSGTAHAIVALAANIGAVVSGLPFSYIAKEYNWGAIFILLEVITVATVLVMLLTWNMRGRVDTSKED